MGILYLNGDYVSSNEKLISHKDCGFTTGIGIFDSMLAIDGVLKHGQDHFDRIRHDSRIVIGQCPSFDYNHFLSICEELMSKNKCGAGFARIRTTISGGIVDAPLGIPTTLTILIDGAPCKPPPKKPIKCAIITDFPRVSGCILENCKRLDYSRNYNARRTAIERGAEEAIMVNTDGNIVCGATSNIFIEESGTLITPPLSDGALAGVTRKNIIKERDVKEESISIERLKDADKAYLTNSFIKLRPIKLIEK